MDNSTVLLLVVLILAGLTSFLIIRLLKVRKNLRATAEALRRSREEFESQIHRAEEMLKLERRRSSEVLKQQARYADLRLRIRVYRHLREHLLNWPSHKDVETGIIAKLIYDNSDAIGRRVEESWRKIKDHSNMIQAEKEVRSLLQHVERKIEAFEQQASKQTIP